MGTDLDSCETRSRFPVSLLGVEPVRPGGMAIRSAVTPLGEEAHDTPDSVTVPAPGDVIGFPQRGGPTVLRLLLGGRLRELREKAGISAEDAGYAIRGSHSKISRLENGRVGFKARDVADLLTLYGIIDAAQRAPIMALVEQ